MHASKFPTSFIRPLLVIVASGSLLACGPRAEEVVAGTPGGEVAMGETSAADPGYVDLLPGEAAELIATGDYLVVNVHIPYQGEIPGTDVHIPYNDLEAHLDRLPAERDAPVLVYCRSARMSRIALEELVARGYTNLLHLDGGMVAWEAAGYELEYTPRR
jgi:rhodanese-related sulfurtransferase